MMRLITNPTARAGRSAARVAFWLTELRRRNIPFTLSETTAPGEAITLARDAVEPTVVAVGGDGTINEVLDGILQAAAPKTLGVLYAGTSPDFCRFHRIPFHDPAAALAVLLAGERTTVDAAQVTLPGGGSAHFGCGLNVGLGADVAAFANAQRRRLGDVPGTAAGLLLAIARGRRFYARLTLDGASHDFPDANHVMVLKNPHIASGLRLDLPLEPAAGNLAVLVIAGRSRSGLLRLVPGFYSGKAAANPTLFIRSAREVTLTTTPLQRVEFDGDPRGHTPVSIALLPRALTLIREANHA